VAVFRRIETPMREWIAGRERKRSQSIGVATVAG
jgi:hypothetical protein